MNAFGRTDAYAAKCKWLKKESKFRFDYYVLDCTEGSVPAQSWKIRFALNAYLETYS